MINITISLSDKLKLFLDRYYANNRTIEDRFFEALNEGFIVPRGKSFYLSMEKYEELTDIIKQEFEVATAYHGDFENNDINI